MNGPAVLEIHLMDRLNYVIEPGSGNKVLRRAT
jgi:hypothetical protein